MTGVRGFDATLRAAPVPATRFLQDFEALSEKSDTPLLDRVLFSYIMTHSRS